MANKKLDDCYFYYYSTCYKGDDCAFRHEENALGCETVCNSWKLGNCKNVHCQYRHMLLKKNRKAIPCFWESQPNGCRKPHCPFLHKKEKPDGISQDSPTVSGGMNQTSGVSMMPKNIPVDSSLMSHEGLRRPNSSTLENDLNFASPPVDPLVVKFEEESDNELDIPSPCKSVAVQSQKKSWVKTLEEIRLEKIQELSAAFYSFTEGIEAKSPNQETEDVMMDVLNKAIVKDLGALTKTTNRSLVKSTVKRKASEDSDSLGFRVLTLAEIRQKRQKRNQDQEPDSTSESERLEDKTSNALNDDSPIQESSSQITSHISGTSVESSEVVDAPGRQKLTNINTPVQSSGTTDVDVSGKNPTDVRSPAIEDVDVYQEKKIKSPQKLLQEDVDVSQGKKIKSPQEDVTDSADVDVPQKAMSSKMSTTCSSLDVPHESIKISPQKVHQCTEGENVDVAQQPIKITSPLKVQHQYAEGTKVDIPHKINVVSPLRQSTTVADVNAHQIQKPVNITSPLCRDVPPQNQGDVDVPSRNEQHVDVPSRNQQPVDVPSKNQQNVDLPSKSQQIVDVPPKKKPIRLKRTMRRDTQEEPHQGANSAKRSKNAEEEQTSLSLNSSRSEDADQSSSNLSEITSNPGEMDTDDILNGIDELLGN